MEQSGVEEIDESVFEERVQQREWEWIVFVEQEVEATTDHLVPWERVQHCVGQLKRFWEDAGAQSVLARSTGIGEVLRNFRNWRCDGFQERFSVDIDTSPIMSVP